MIPFLKAIPRVVPLEPLAAAVLGARAAHSTSALAHLCDGDVLPANLRSTHQVVGRALPRLHISRGIAPEQWPIEHLLGLFSKLAVAPLKKSHGNLGDPHRKIAKGLAIREGS